MRLTNPVLRRIVQVLYSGGAFFLLVGMTLFALDQQVKAASTGLFQSNDATIHFDQSDTAWCQFDPVPIEVTGAYHLPDEVEGRLLITFQVTSPNPSSKEVHDYGKVHDDGTFSITAQWPGSDPKGTAITEVQFTATLVNPDSGEPISSEASVRYTCSPANCTAPTPSTPCPCAFTPTPTATTGQPDIETVTPTVTETRRPRPTRTPTPTETRTPRPTRTPTEEQPPTETPTATQEQPGVETFTPTVTETQPPPPPDTETPTPTNTQPAPPPDTETPTPTNTQPGPPPDTETPTPTNTQPAPPPDTETPTPTSTQPQPGIETFTPTPTNTQPPPPTATNTPTTPPPVVPTFTPTNTLTPPAPGNPLTLTHVCGYAGDNRMFWQVTNSSSSTVSFTWDSPSGESGSGVIAPNSTGYFSTSSNSQTVRIYINGQLVSQATAGGSCLVFLSPAYVCTTDNQIAWFVNNNNNVAVTFNWTIDNGPGGTETAQAHESKFVTFSSGGMHTFVITWEIPPLSQRLVSVNSATDACFAGPTQTPTATSTQPQPGVISTFTPTPTGTATQTPTSTATQPETGGGVVPTFTITPTRTLVPTLPQPQATQTPILIPPTGVDLTPAYKWSFLSRMFVNLGMVFLGVAFLITAATFRPRK